MQDGVSAIVDSNGVLDEKQFKKTTILCSYCNVVVTILSLSLSLFKLRILSLRSKFGIKRISSFF